MLVDKQSELMSDLLFTVHQHGSDDVTWKPPIVRWFREKISQFAKLKTLKKTESSEAIASTY